MIRRTQLIQSGVTINDGPTLEQIKAEEEAQRQPIMKRSKMSEFRRRIDEGEANPDGEETVESSADLGETPDYEGMTVPELKAILKESGKLVSGKKVDLISRILSDKMSRIAVICGTGMSDLSNEFNG